MTVSRFTALSLAIIAAPAAGAQTAGGRTPPSRRFQRIIRPTGRRINVGTSDLELKPDGEPGHYLYTWTITARGIFRLYRSEVTQKSWFSIVDEHVRPEKYRGEDGSSSVELDFDWSGGRIRGTSEKKPVDLALKEGTQDVMSIQVEVMLDLKNGNLPKTFHIIDKDRTEGIRLLPGGHRQTQNRAGRTRHRDRRQSARRQQSHPAHVVRAVARASCRCRRSAPATANSNSRCGSRA